MPAKIANPRKAFQFTVYIPGLNPFLCQELTLPDIELEQVEHGDTNFDVKTAGRKKVSNLRLSKIAQSTEVDQFVYNWMRRIQNTLIGGGDLPDMYKRPILVEQYANDGITVIERHQLEGCWPQKVNGVNYSRTASQNTVYELEFSVDDADAR